MRLMTKFSEMLARRIKIVRETMLHAPPLVESNFSYETLFSRKSISNILLERLQARIVLTLEEPTTPE